MVRKIKKKGYFAKRRRLTVIVLLIIVTLCILITALIVKLVYNHGKKNSKSTQTSETNNDNRKYQNYVNDFESNPENKSRVIFEDSYKISNSLSVVLNRKLTLNNSELELDCTVDGYTSFQVNIFRSKGNLIAFNLDTLLELWQLIRILNIGEAKNLTEPEQVSHTILTEGKLILDLRDYRIHIIILRALYEDYKRRFGDKNRNIVLSIHILTFIRSFETRLFSITVNRLLDEKYFKEWQSKTKNKLALIFLDKFQNIVLGLPLFLIFHFITKQKSKEMKNNGKLSCGQYKALLDQMINVDTFTKEQIDVIKGKFYKLFNLLETQEIQSDATEDEPEKIDAVYQLLQLLDDDLKKFLVVYKK